MPAADLTIPAELLDQLSIEPDHRERVARDLTTYLNLLAEGADRYGLVSTGDAADTERLVTRHVLDSVAPWRHVAERMGEGGVARRRLYDMGSGGGLPGVPLAIALADRLDAAFLVDRSGRRIAFLETVIAALPEVPLRILEGDADRGHTYGEEREIPAVAVFRAYQQTTPRFLKMTARALGTGTPVIGWKGRLEKTREEAAIVAESPWARDVRIEPVVVPGLDAERCLLSWITVRP